MAAGDIKIFSEKYNPRKAIVLEGVDDAIQIDAWGTDRQSAGDTVGTITAWVMPETKAAIYTIIAAGDAGSDEFIDFSIVAGLLHLEVSDAGTTDIDLESDDIVVEPHVWTHVAVVQTADLALPKFYVNGKEIAATLDAGGDASSWFDQMSGIDSANIGYLEAVAATAQDYAGGVGQVSHWNLALTADEIKSDYATGVPEKNSAGNTPSDLKARVAVVIAAQVSRWEWDGDLLDSWVGANNGTVVSNAVLDPNYNSMTSQLKTVETIVADDISIAMDGGVMSAVVIKAA